MLLIPHCSGQFPQQRRIWREPHGLPAAAAEPSVCFLFPLQSLSSPPLKPDTAFNSPLASGKHFFLFVKSHLSGLGSKITADGDCSHETKIHLLLGRKAMTNPDSILKSRGITLPTKVHIVKTMIFPVVMYGCESRTIKEAECQRIDTFELWRWRRLLRVPWTARRSNQSIQKEISPGCSLEGLMLKLKLQYFGHLMQRIDSLEKTLMLGGIGGRRRRSRQRMRCLDGITDWTDVSLSELRELVTDRRPGVL